MVCMRCGASMSGTTGGHYICSKCGFSINDLVYRPSTCEMPVPQAFGIDKGWICPVCGRGLAPWVSTCPCKNSDLTITYSTKLTSKDISQDSNIRNHNYFSLVNDREE